MCLLWQHANQGLVLMTSVDVTTKPSAYENAIDKYHLKYKNTQCIVSQWLANTEMHNIYIIYYN